MGENNKNENINVEPPKNQEGKYVIDKNNPAHVRWLHQQQANRGAKYVNQGRKEVLDEAAERSMPLVTAALVGSAAAAPVITGLSLAGGYLGSQLGKWIAPENYKREGSVIGGTLGGMLAPGLKILPGLVNNTIYSPNPKSQYLRYAIGKFKYGFDAKIPDLIRRTKTPMPKVNVLRRNSNIRVSPLENRFRFETNGEVSPVITNFSTDLPVIPNSGGSWTGFDINIIKGRNLLGKRVISTKPQDTFTFGDKITVPKKDIITISSKQGTVPEEQLMEQFLKIYRRPTQKDYQFMDYVFQPKYRSEVFPNTPIDNINHPLIKYLADGDMRSRLNQPWDKVMYDIAPTVESEFRDDLGIVLRSQLDHKKLLGL